MKKVLWVIPTFCLLMTALCPLSSAMDYRGRRVPGPMLVSPDDDTDVSGKTSLEFRWSPEGDRSSFDHYDFRLYKGHETVEAGLILQKDISSGQTTVPVETGLFEDGKTYAWSVRQVGSRKSRSSYSVFKIIKHETQRA